MRIVNVLRWVGLAGVVLLLTACGVLGGGQERVLGSNSGEPLAGPAWTTCSQACRDRAQCGVAQSMNLDVVLLNTVRPDVINHNMILGAGTEVMILDVTEVELVKTINFQEIYPARFYLVQVPERAPAWIAGWCLEQ